MEDRSAIEKELREIEREVKEPEIEEINLKIIVSKNIHKDKGKGKNKSKEFIQYKMNLPKNILNIISDNGKQEIKAIGNFNNETNQLNIKILKE